jgi:hypothetical protein
VGPVASQWRGVADALPGVQLVSINGPAEVTTAPGVSIIRSAVMPIKRNSMRGVVLSGASGNDAQWVAEAARVVLPGLRVVGQGEPPSVDGLDVVASAGGWWVAARRAR